MSSDPLILFFLGACSVGAALLLSRRQRAPLPPGPRGLPIVGNAFQVDPMRLYPKMKEWADEYGELFLLRFGMQTLVVLNTPEAAHELLVVRGTKHSSRPPSRVAQNIMSAGQRISFMPYGREWKTARQSFRDAIGSSKREVIRNMQELESQTLIHDLMCHGEKSIIEHQAQGDDVPDGHWFALVRRYSLSLALHIVYGKRVNRINSDVDIHKVFDIAGNLSRVAHPGRYLVDSFPLLDILPDWAAPWRAAAHAMHEREMELYGGLLHEVQSSQRGTGYVASYLRQRAEAGFAHAPGRGLVGTTSAWMRDEFIAYSAGTILEGGADTTAGSLQSALLLLLANPHALEEARAELDAVIGPDRLPEFSDEERLPYIRACVQELFRRRPVGPLGLPHAAGEDDIYKGFLIPRGAILIGNIWAIHMDPIRFPYPLEFRPERFLDPSNPVDIHTFGWGRRQCPGRATAEDSLFIVLARIIWALELHAPVLPDPADESSEGTWSDGFISLPRLYGIAFKAREGRGGVIRAAYERAQREWEALDLEANLR